MPGTITFRPRKAIEPEIELIKRWCVQNNVNFNDIMNSYLPAISIALLNYTKKTDEGELYIQSDFGDIKIVKRDEHKLPRRLI